MLVLGNGRHVKHSMDNHFSCICSLCIFYFVQDFCIWVAQLFFNLVFIIQNSYFWKKCFLNFKALKGREISFTDIRCCLKTSTPHYPFKSQQHIRCKWLTTSQDGNHKWYWWHPPHQESVHRKESMSDWWCVAFPRCILSDVQDFYAFNDPCFALYQKQGSDEYTERATLLPPFYRCFVAWRKLLWRWLYCNLEKIWFYNTLCKIVSKQASKQKMFGRFQFCLSWREKGKKILHFNKTSSAVCRVGGCAHWITTLLLLHSIKSDSSSERGSWFDTFLLK